MIDPREFAQRAYEKTGGPTEALKRVYDSYFANERRRESDDSDKKYQALFRVYIRAAQLIQDVQKRYPGESWKCPFMESLDVAIKDYEKQLGD